MSCRSFPSKGLGTQPGFGAPVQVGCNPSKSFPVLRIARKVEKSLPPSGSPDLSGVKLREMMCAEPIPGGGTNSPKSRPPPRYVAGLTFTFWPKYGFPPMANSVRTPALWQPSQSHQSPVLPLQVQRDRRNVESLLNPRIFLIVPVVAVIRPSAG